MGRKVITKIEFVFDEDDYFAEEEDLKPRSDDELIRYATACFAEDIDRLVKYNEVEDAVRTEIRTE